MDDRKTCFKCGCSKERSEFYRHPAMGDGLLGKCKECTKADARTNRNKNLLKYAAYERLRFADPVRKQKVAQYQRNSRFRNPEKYAARVAVGSAVRDGRLIRPAACTCCGTPGDVEAHHADYSKPLEVDWLCFVCHREEKHGQVVLSK